jgi:hypothetical protein
MARGYKSGLATGLVVSAGLVLLGPLWRQVFARWGRPVAKGAIMGGMATYDVLRARAAELAEQGQDLLAEVELERAAQRVPPGRTE